jgi:stage IV sporulation protein FB
MLGMPAPTAYDLRFRLFGIPVRVHPLFWLVTALLGGVGQNDVPVVVLWMACVFVSILIHEFGHGLMGQFFGYRSQIALYGMGGLCDSEGHRQSPRERLAVIAAGPGAGLAFCALVFLVLNLAFGVRPLDMIALIGFGPGNAMEALAGLLPVGRYALVAVIFLVQINLIWSILNLVPIWPLDGGQLTRVILGMANPAHGPRWAHVISLLLAGIGAVLVYQRLNNPFLALFLGYFALTNYQVLQAMQWQSRYDSSSTSEDEADWWRR